MTLFEILDIAIKKGATDVHLSNGLPPTFRIRRNLEMQEDLEIMTEEMLEVMTENLLNNEEDRVNIYKTEKKLDISLGYENYKFRINISISKGVPTYAIRLIDNSPINLQETHIQNIVDQMKKYQRGIILITGRVNSGKSTTMNAFIQEVNKNENKKIVTFEDPIEYEHNSDKSIVLQKEVGAHKDVPTFYEGLINILREDSDIVVVGEIRDRETMDVVFDLAESGQLVIGTLHTKSSAETIDRIISMYSPQEQIAIKYLLSSTLRIVCTQRLVKDLNGDVMIVPEVMVVDNVIGALIRKDKFVISEIEDALHSGADKGCISIEYALAELYNNKKITLATIKDTVDKDKFEKIKEIIVRTAH
ncbi:MAG: ATPase, T2SS/T4P/T4SS family [Clostridia bacterium]